MATRLDTRSQGHGSYLAPFPASSRSAPMPLKGPCGMPQPEISNLEIGAGDFAIWANAAEAGNGDTPRLLGSP